VYFKYQQKKTTIVIAQKIYNNIGIASFIDKNNYKFRILLDSDEKIRTDIINPVVSKELSTGFYN